MMILLGIYVTGIKLGQVCCENRDLWDEWWGYGSGTSGPEFWGKLYSICSKGKYQSPINIDPDFMIYDPNLSSVAYEGSRVNGTLRNTRHDLTFEVNYSDPHSNSFIFRTGPLSYAYRLYNIKMHFGLFDDLGSEHTIAGKRFPIELQFMGFNIDLFKNHTEAVMSTHGLAIISVLGSIGEMMNLEFDKVLTAVKYMNKQGDKQPILDFNILDIIPRTTLFITYEGSLTQPGCQETVTWLIVNKPLHISKQQIMSLRELQEWSDHRPSVEANNFRPTLPVNRRVVRTNIKPFHESEECALKVQKSYKVNRILIIS
ncbi:hypothetical protein DPMN_113336 [Dreissena polymorpha]|uniref:Alpha-carbonic anhydrase domain-containing protein n=1 Tax=Dreissena polymorpha TaxID=45954 RepID=A0A9D4QQL0_DREPO|nr:hypothetical protein DPMN_113336 [Dreissena polymorpha]